MKKKWIGVLSLLFVLATLTGRSQSNDPEVFKSNHIVVTQNLQTARYKIVTNEKTYDSLYFVKQFSYDHFQVLSANNRIFCIGRDGKEKVEIVDPCEYSFPDKCDSFFIRQTPSYFLISSTQEYCFHGVPNLIDRIERKYADSIFLINGKTEFNLDSSFCGLSELVRPETIILMKDMEYFSRENPSLKFDSIDFSNYGNSLKTVKNGLYGILGVVEPKYRRIDDFDFFLAKAEKVNNEIVHIDYKGNEFGNNGLSGNRLERNTSINLDRNEQSTIGRHPVFNDSIKEAYWDLTELSLRDDRLQKIVLSFIDTCPTYNDQYEMFRDFMDFLYDNNIMFIQSIDWKSSLGDFEWFLNHILNENYANVQIQLPAYYSDDMHFMQDGVIEKFTESMKAKGLQVGFIDTASDSYTFFVHLMSEKERIKQVIKAMGLAYFEPL
jgi:hypothetical protein